MPKPDREQILAFRLAAHNLTRRLGPRLLTKAAAACGVQETPLGSAAIAFLARVEKLTPALLDRALFEDRTLVSLWAMRGAPYVVPAKDLGVFTEGALPLDPASFKQSLGGWSDALERVGLDPFETLERMASAAQALLDGRTLNVNDLRDGIYRRVRSLTKVKRPAFARDDMPEPLFRAVGTTGSACIVAGRGTGAELARIDQWLGTTPPPPDPAEARAELARRFLHCYGPATAQQFADWTQRSLADAKNAFALIEEELVDVTVGRAKGWLLRRDDKALSSPPEPTGVRLLPVQDPYLQQRDRATVLPKEADRRKLWQAIRGPGAVLLDGEIVATWRARTKGNRLEVTIEPFGRLARPAREAISAEAEGIAPFRGSETAEVTIVRLGPLLPWRVRPAHRPGSDRNEESVTMLRGFATINYWAADLAAAREWYSELLGIEPYFERAELDGRIIGPDDPDYHRARLGYVEFRIGDYQHDLGLIDSRYAPGGPPTSTGGVVFYWHVDDVRAAVEKLLSMGAKEYLPITERGDSGFVTAAVVDPFGNILGVMYNPHYLEILRAREQA